MLNSPLNNRLARLEQSAASAAPATEWRIVRQIIEADGTKAETLERDRTGHWEVCNPDWASSTKT